MYRKYIFLIIFISSVIQVSNPAAAKEKLVKSLPLMGGRYFINVPENARIEKRGHDIMEPESSDEEETRILYDNGKERFVIFATEMYKYSAKNILDEVNREYNSKEKTYRFEKYITGKKCKIITGWPIEEKINNGAVILLNAFIEGNDNILASISFYVNEEGFKYNKKKYVSLTKSVLSTIVQGKKKLRLSKRPYTIYLFGGPKKISETEITVPDNYAISENAGPDFMVYHLTGLTAYSADDNSGINIYIGFDPSYAYEDLKLKAEQARKLPAKIFNKDIEWLIFERERDNKPEYILSEVQFKPFDGIGSCTVHVFIYSNSCEQMESQHRIIEGMHLK